MRRLRRPWLLAFPLTGMVVGVVWLRFSDRGTSLPPGAKISISMPEAVGIASSDIGYRIQAGPLHALVYDNQYQQDGEEKLLSRKVPHPLEPRYKLSRTERQGRTVRAFFGDGRGASATLIATLSADGRSVVETWMLPEAKEAPQAEPALTIRTDEISGTVYERILRPIKSPAGPTIVRPNVWINIDSEDGEAQRVVGPLLEDLLTAVHPRLRRSIAPMGLTNEIYFGHVFWDADVWVFPALALLTPEAAAEIPKYRLRTLPQARQNYWEWWSASRPTATGKLGPVPAHVKMIAGAKFAWESSETGKETVPGPSRFEDHISGSVAWSVGFADDLGLLPNGKAKQLRDFVGSFYGARSVSTERGLEIKGTVSPDEHHTGDNDLYTNLVAQYATGDRYYLPRDERSFLTYDGDRGKGYKQAAALLAVYPLQYPPAEKEAGVMLDRFALGVTPNGPAMTDAIHAIVAARIGRADEGLAYWRKSWEGFYDLERGMFSERRRGTRREYFYTGAAGTLQAVLFGFVGLRIDKAGGPGTLVAKLKNGKELRCSPHLPKGWRSVAVSGLTAMGKRYDLKVYADGRVDLRPATSE